MTLYPVLAVTDGISEWPGEVHGPDANPPQPGESRLRAVPPDLQRRPHPPRRRRATPRGQLGQRQRPRRRRRRPHWGAVPPPAAAQSAQSAASQVGGRGRGVLQPDRPLVFQLVEAEESEAADLKAQLQKPPGRTAVPHHVLGRQM